MSNLQDISRTRNWLKGRIASVRNNLVTVEEFALHDREKQQLKEAVTNLDDMLTDWDKRYAQLKEDIRSNA